LKKAIGRDRKGKISLVLYILGLIAAFIYVWAAIACYITVALLWFVPDTRIESILKEK
jgi:hypothetical protein